jgi:mono/diheme cytochrome c family protein
LPYAVAEILPGEFELFFITPVRAAYRWPSIRLRMTHRSIPSTLLAVAVSTCGFAQPACAAGPDAAGSKQIEFFETKVRPIFAEKCQKCHGADKQKGGLRLDSRDAVLKGGESGAVVVPGKPAESPMIDAVNYRGLEMPPTGKLKEREIAALVEWIRMGAPWPKEKAPAAGSRRSDFSITDEDRHYWAFQSVGHPQPPHVRRGEWVANPIDAFVLAGLEEKGLAPNPPADPRTLIRRVFFDLLGLPPTPEEVDAFVADHSPSAYERLVDEVLSRQQYGERWGRHWLDVTRYAQTNGFERDAEKPEAWRYRDYVIQSFNDDKPYDRFVLEQLAGDELEHPTPDSIIATGIYRLAIWDDEPDDRPTAAWDELDEMIRTTGSAFLGLTFGCARCHNHMYDPISQEDYYQLAAIFRNVEQYGTPISSTHFKANDEGILTPLASTDEVKAWRTHQRELKRQIARTKAKLDSLKKANGGKNLTGSEGEERKRIVKTLADLDKAAQAAPFPQALSVRECGSPLRETRVLIRGNVASPGKKVEPRLPTVFGGKAIVAQIGVEAIPAAFHGGEGASESERGARSEFASLDLSSLGVKQTLGLRRQLATWITDKDNPLTPRVMMNRLWQGYFGRGIVRTADNFGRAGTSPTHPQLLAWLARDFIDGDWRLKRMHKRILLSNAYRMSSSTLNAAAHSTDVDNELLWRQNLRRLDAEAIRDAVLAISGRLNLAMGGRGIFPKLSQEVLATQSRPGLGWGQSSPRDESRRSVYIYLKRTLMVPFLETFDYTNTAESLGTRPVTTVAPQALLLLNGEFTSEQATALADRVRHEVGTDPKKQIARLFRLALGRLPTVKEGAIAAQLLQGAGSPQNGTRRADSLRSLCLVVLNLNEFVYVD